MFNITVRFVGIPVDATIKAASIFNPFSPDGAWPDKVTNKDIVVPYNTNVYDDATLGTLAGLDPVDSLTTKFAIFDQAYKKALAVLAADPDADLSDATANPGVEFEVATYEDTLYYTQIGARIDGFVVETEAVQAAAAQAGN